MKNPYVTTNRLTPTGAATAAILIVAVAMAVSLVVDLMPDIRARSLVAELFGSQRA